MNQNYTKRLIVFPYFKFSIFKYQGNTGHISYPFFQIWTHISYPLFPNPIQGVKRIHCHQFSIIRASIIFFIKASINFEVTRYVQRTNVQSTYLKSEQRTHQATGLTPTRSGNELPPKDQPHTFTPRELERQQHKQTHPTNLESITQCRQKEGNRLEETYKSTKLCVEPRFPSAHAWSGTDLTNFPPSPPPDAADPGLRQAKPILYQELGEFLGLVTFSQRDEQRRRRLGGENSLATRSVLLKKGCPHSPSLL